MVVRVKRVSVMRKVMREAILGVAVGRPLPVGGQGQDGREVAGQRPAARI
jgi:hypothetical protein